MTKAEYQKKREVEKKKNFAKIKASYKKHYDKDLKPGVVLKRVCKECNCSRATYFEAIRS